MEFTQVVEEFKKLREEYPVLNNYLIGMSFGKRSLGWCQCFPKKLIKISVYHMAGSEDERVLKTLKHECAHALDYEEMGYSSGHGANFKKWCRILGIEAGSKSGGNFTKKKPQSKYTLTCPVCGKISHKHKMHKGATYSCGKCSPKVFNEDYALEVKINY